MLSAIKAVVGTSALLGLAGALSRREGVSNLSQGDDDRKMSDDLSDATSSPAVQPSEDLPLLKQPMPTLTLASLELGSYAACGSLIHAWGLSQIPATTAGFLLQITTVLTPLIAVVAGDRIPTRVWAAIALAGAGTALIGIDGLSNASGGTDALASGSILGKLAIIGAACCYSMGTFRLGQNAPGLLPGTAPRHSCSPYPCAHIDRNAAHLCTHYRNTPATHRYFWSPLLLVSGHNHTCTE